MMARRRAMNPNLLMKKGGVTAAEVEKELKQHESKSMSKAHKKAMGGKIDSAETKTTVKGNAGKYLNTKVVNGDKTDKAHGTKGIKEKNGGGYANGGTIKGNAGKFLNTKVVDGDKTDKASGTTGVKMGNAGGFKMGGKVNWENRPADTAKPGKSNTTTGGVKNANGGGYKMGGSAKKAYATGGTVDSGKPVAMPQGAKKPSQPISTNRFTGTFKKGGTVTPAEGNLMKAFGKENAPAMKSAKAQSNEVYSKYQKMNGGGSVSDKETDMSKGAYDAHYANEKAENEAMRNMVLGAPKKLMDSVKGMFSPKAPQGQGAVTKTEKSITVSPAGKRRGGRAC